MSRYVVRPPGVLYPDDPPPVANAADYEFDRVGASSLPAGWSWFNQGSSTYTEDQGAGVLGLPAEAGPQWRGITRAIPGASSWTVTAKLLSTGRVNDFGPGLFLSDGTKLVVLFCYTDGTNAAINAAYVRKYTNATTYSADFAASQHQLVFPSYYRIRRNSVTSYDFAVSVGGRGWFTVANAQDVSAFLTPTVMGFGSSPSGIGAARAVECEWFRVT